MPAFSHTPTDSTYRPTRRRGAFSFFGGSTDPLDGIPLALRLQTHTGVVTGTDSFYRVSGGDSSFDGDYYPNGDEQGGKPIYQLDNGTKLIVFNLDESRWELIGETFEASNDNPNRPDMGTWTGGYDVGGFSFNIYTPAGLYQNTLCTVTATTEGDSVAGSRDPVGSIGIQATQSSSSKQGMLTFKQGVPCILADAVDDEYETPALSGTDFTYCVALQISQVSNYPMVISQGSGFKELRFLEFTSRPQYNPADPMLVTAADSQLNNWAVISVQSTSTTSQLFVNGVSQGLSGAGGSGDAITLLNRFGSSFNFGGYIVAILISTEANTENRIRLENYCTDLIP